jgi:dTDP-glucose 4,6-dehydratase
MRILVTGGAGFIGSNFIYRIIKEHSDWIVTNLDKLTYAGNLENLEPVKDSPQYEFIQGDIDDRSLLEDLFSRKYEVVINFAAESHVDRSILDASPFIDSNIRGVMTLLECANKYKVGKYVQVSTDEVYGSSDTESFIETDCLSPSSPYSASKASGDLLCLSYWKTYGVPVVVTRCTNNYGPYQFPEKLIPLVISNAKENKPIPVYGDGLNIRDWIHVLDHCRALDVVIQKGEPGEIYNIAGLNERTNLDIIKKIIKLLGKSDNLIQFVKDRPGHDRRYSIDITKINTKLNWQPDYSFEDGIEATVKWYIENEEWWRKIKTGEYLEYYERMYLNR